MLETRAGDGEDSHDNETSQHADLELFGGFELEDEDEEPETLVQGGMALQHPEITSLCSPAGASLDARGEDRREAYALAPFGTMSGKTTPVDQP